MTKDKHTTHPVTPATIAEYLCQVKIWPETPESTQTAMERNEPFHWRRRVYFTIEHLHNWFADSDQARYVSPKTIGMGLRRLGYIKQRIMLHGVSRHLWSDSPLG